MASSIFWMSFLILVSRSCIWLRALLPSAEVSNAFWELMMATLLNCWAYEAPARTRMATMARGAMVRILFMMTSYGPQPYNPFPEGNDSTFYHDGAIFLRVLSIRPRAVRR